MSDFGFFSALVEAPIAQASVLGVGAVYAPSLETLNELNSHPQFREPVRETMQLFGAAHKTALAAGPSLEIVNEGPVPSRVMGRAVPYGKNPGFPTPGF